MACEVVENIRLGEVIEAVWPADGDGSGELAAAEAVEEQVRGDVPAHGFGLEAGQRPKALIYFVDSRYTVDRQMKRLEASQETVIGIGFPAGADALVETPPGLMVFGGIQIVNLGDKELPAVAGFFHEWSMAGSKSRRRGSLRHGKLLLVLIQR
jgi:hypothetical protein